MKSKTYIVFLSVVISLLCTRCTDLVTVEKSAQHQTYFELNDTAFTVKWNQKTYNCLSIIAPEDWVETKNEKADLSYQSKIDPSRQMFFILSDIGDKSFDQFSEYLVNEFSTREDARNLTIDRFFFENDLSCILMNFVYVTDDGTERYSNSLFFADGPKLVDFTLKTTLEFKTVDNLIFEEILNNLQYKKYDFAKLRVLNSQEVWRFKS